MMNDICKQDGNFYNMENCFWRNETYYPSYYEFKILGYLNLASCIMMVISNVLVIMVLSRKSMSSPMNTIFAHMAITELLAGLSYIPRIWHEFFRAEECAIPQHRTFFWEVLSLNSNKLAFTFRHIGTLLTVMLAVWRYIAVIHPLKERRWCNSEITHKFIQLGYVCGVVITIPIYFAAQVGSVNKLLDKNGCPTTNYTIGNSALIYESQLTIESHPALYISHFLFYGVVLKLLPSVAFTYISYRLIMRLIEAKKQCQSMIRQQDQHRDRTTIRLGLILALFIIGEVPQGIFRILIIYYGPAFYWRNNHNYGFETFNTITHLSESFNFIIHYAMSQQFKETFKELVRCRINS